MQAIATILRAEVNNSIIKHLAVISKAAQQPSQDYVKNQVAQEILSFQEEIQNIKDSKKSESKKMKKLDEVATRIKERIEFYERIKVPHGDLLCVYETIRPNSKMIQKHKGSETTQSNAIDILKQTVAPSIRHITDSVSVQTDASGEETLCVEIDLDKEGLRYDQVMARHAAQQEQQIDNEAAAIIDGQSTVVDEVTTIFPYQEYLAKGLSLMDEPAKSKNFFRAAVGDYRDKAQMHWADWVEDKVSAVKAMEEVQAIRDELQAFQKEAEAMKIDTKIWRTELDFRFIDDVLSALRQGSKKFVNTQANAAKNPAMAEAMRRAGVRKG